MKTIPYGRQTITSDDIARVLEALQGDFITQGPKVSEFEQRITCLLGAKYALAVNSGTAALHLACMALGVTEGDTVITTPITFAASANAARYCGAAVEFVDIDPVTRCMSMDLLEEKLRKKPKGFFKAVVVVDFAGHPADLVRLKALGETYGFSIIEDACHALGAEFRDSTGTWRKCGDCSFADIAVLSFHPVKHITTGEGGMLLTNSSALNERAKLLRTHGITKDAHLLQENHGGWYYEMQELGYNYRISDFQCALGLSQLDRLESGNARRREIAAIYDEGLLELPIDLSAVSPSIRHAYHLYVIETDRRRDLYDYLKRHDILAQVHYVPVNMMPYYRRLGHAPEATPNALAYYSRCLSLPMFPGLTGQEQEYVIEKIRAFYTSV